MERLNVAIVWMASPWRWIAIEMQNVIISMENTSQQCYFETEKKNLLNHSVHPKLIGLVGSLVQPLILMVRGRFKSCQAHRCEPDRNGDQPIWSDF